MDNNTTSETKAGKYCNSLAQKSIRKEPNEQARKSVARARKTLSGELAISEARACEHNNIMSETSTKAHTEEREQTSKQGEMSRERDE